MCYYSSSLILLWKPTWPIVEGGVGAVQAVQAVRRRSQIESPQKRELCALSSHKPTEAAHLQDTSEIPG